MKVRLAWIVSALAVLGCEATPSRVVQDRPDPQAAANALEMFDADKDGSLLGPELDKAPGLKAAMPQIDADGDGGVSAVEIQARIERWAATKMGRMTVSCLVTRDGSPVPGVEVRLVPEPFLKGTVQTAVGTTDPRGIALPSAPESEETPRGVGPGFYRVEITGGDPPVPAKFNTATTLGVEVATDATALLSGSLKFDVGK